MQTGEGRAPFGGAGERDAGEEISIEFLGAAGAVTGSRYLLGDRSAKIMIDCGLFQGGRELRERNWEPALSDHRAIDTIVLTHAHLDHSGYIPRFVKEGWSGRILCTDATADLCGLLLPDSGFLQENDAAFANRHGYSRHKPALPLYTKKDAEVALDYLDPVRFGAYRSVAGGAELRFHRAGHILGAAFVELKWRDRTILFSGDLGRFNDPVMLDPSPPVEADYLIVESTYGNRSHEALDAVAALGDAIERCVRRGGTVVIPAFAVGRAQSILYHLSRLRAAGRISNVPVYLDSPMAIDASGIFCRHAGDHRLSEAECDAACKVARYVRDVEESKALTMSPVPKVIISASGMATGGRVLHHLKRYAPDGRNLILFAGFQASGTRGAAMVAGAPSVKIHGEQVPVRAEVRNLSMLSAHADADEILKWLGQFVRAPRMTFITHGEPDAAAALARRIGDELGWPCQIPGLGDRVVLE